MPLTSNPTMNQVEILMETGKKEDAKAMLDRLLSESPQDTSTYADAVNLYLSEKMYVSAIEVFSMYTQLTGKSLDRLGGPDYSLKDIEEMQRAEINKSQIGIANLEAPNLTQRDSFTLLPISSVGLFGTTIYFGLTFVSFYAAVVFGYAPILKIVMLLGGLKFLTSGVALASSRIHLANNSFTAFQVWLNLSSRRSYMSQIALPRRRTIKFSDIDKISIHRLSMYRGRSLSMVVIMKDRTNRVLVLAQYRKQDCKILVTRLRQFGVNVDVQPGILGDGS